MGDIWNKQWGRHSLKVGGDFRDYDWPMWGFFQNRGYYQFTNGFTTQTATNDGTGAALASLLLGLPVVKQRQAGIPEMNLRQWYADGFVQDNWRVTQNTTLNLGVRYEYMSPLTDIQADKRGSNLTFENGVPYIFIGGQDGTPAGLLYTRKLNFAPRVGLTHAFQGKFPFVMRASYGSFLHSRGYEHLVQSASQRAFCFPANPAERQLHSQPDGIQLCPTGSGLDRGQLHGL